jgi:hypothetical protein
MVSGTPRVYKFVALAVAIIVTTGVQGTMLAGFNQVAVAGQMATLTQCTAATHANPAL